MKPRSPEYQRMMYQKHREKRLAAKKAEYVADPEAARAYRREQYAKHREERVERARAYRVKKREEVNAKAAERYRAGGEELKAHRRELAKTPERRAKQCALQRRWLERNPEKAQIHYAKNLLAEQTGLRARDIPNDIAEAKAEQLKITRWVREQVTAIADRSASAPRRETGVARKGESGGADRQSPETSSPTPRTD